MSSIAPSCWHIELALCQLLVALLGFCVRLLVARKEDLGRFGAAAGCDTRLQRLFEVLELKMLACRHKEATLGMNDTLSR